MISEPSCASDAVDVIAKKPMFADMQGTTHLVLTHMHERNPDVAQNPIAHAPGSEGDLIQGHAIHFDGCWVLLLLKVDVAHVDPQEMRLHFFWVIDQDILLLI